MFPTSAHSIRAKAEWRPVAVGSGAEYHRDRKVDVKIDELDVHDLADEPRSFLELDDADAIRRFERGVERAVKHDVGVDPPAATRSAPVQLVA
jgi:hypothetical protein